MIEINRNPSRRQLVQFGFVWLGFVAGFGAIARFKLDSPTAGWALWLLALVVPVTGWLLPPVMRAVFVGMSYLAWPIGMVVSFVVLAAVYYGVVTPLGLIMRVVGYDPMRRRFDPRADSYWITRQAGEDGARRYFRQF